MKTNQRNPVIRLIRGSDYPSLLLYHLGDRAPASVTAVGNLAILGNRPLALFCSVKCPGSLILQTYDLAQQFRRTETTVIGGFHSPLERECLTILLRGTAPIIICVARSVEGMRIPGEYRKPLEEGRLLLLSPFDEKDRRATVETALLRNRFVAALADSVFVVHAEPASKTEEFCREVMAMEKPLYTLDAEANANLLSLGAEPVQAAQANRWLARLIIEQPR